MLVLVRVRVRVLASNLRVERQSHHTRALCVAYSYRRYQEHCTIFPFHLVLMAMAAAAGLALLVYKALQPKPFMLESSNRRNRFLRFQRSDEELAQARPPVLEGAVCVRERE